jgi:hypothetical protein
MQAFKQPDSLMHLTAASNYHQPSPTPSRNTPESECVIRKIYESNINLDKGQLRWQGETSAHTTRLSVLRHQPGPTQGRDLGLLSES